MAVKQVLVYGATGALGSSLIARFKESQWRVIGISNTRTAQADHHLVVDPASSLNGMTEQGLKVTEWLHSTLGREGDGLLDAILCVAGGYVMGDVSSPGVLEGADMMFKRNVYPAMISASLVQSFLKPDGLVVLVGSSYAQKPTPYAIGYGSANAAVHHLVSSLVSPGSGLPEKAHVVGLLPGTLDTEACRQAMPDADRSSWTPLGDISQKITAWIDKREDIPRGLVVVRTADGRTSFSPPGTE